MILKPRLYGLLSNKNIRPTTADEVRRSSARWSKRIETQVVDIFSYRRAVKVIDGPSNNLTGCAGRNSEKLK